MGQLSAACGGISSLWIITDFLSCSHLSDSAQVLHYKKQQPLRLLHSWPYYQAERIVKLFGNCFCPLFVPRGIETIETSPRSKQQSRICTATVCLWLDYFGIDWKQWKGCSYLGASYFLESPVVTWRPAR